MPLTRCTKLELKSRFCYSVYCLLCCSLQWVVLLFSFSSFIYNKMMRETLPPQSTASTSSSDTYLSVTCGTVLRILLRSWQNICGPRAESAMAPTFLVLRIIAHSLAVQSARPVAAHRNRFITILSLRMYLNWAPVRQRGARTGGLNTNNIMFGVL